MMTKKRLADDASGNSGEKVKEKIMTKKSTEMLKKIIRENPNKTISKFKPEKKIKREGSSGEGVKRSSMKLKKVKPKKTVKRLQRRRKRC